MYPDPYSYPLRFPAGWAGARDQRFCTPVIS